MSESESVKDLLAKAESAAAAGDLQSAGQLLQAVARNQERELGPMHPDLANTFNNLAVVAEKTGRPGDAEAYYRRAVAIAAASLPADDPMVAATRQNLEDFCRAQGIPVDPSPEPALPPTPSAAPSPEPAPHLAPAAVVAFPPGAAAPPPPAPPPPEPAPHLAPAAVVASHPVPATPPSRSLAKAAIAIVVLLIVALFVMRRWSEREGSAPAPGAAPAPTPSAQTAPPPAPEPASPQPAPVAVEPVQPPAAERRDADRNASGTPRAPQRAAEPVGLAIAQLCRTLSTSGAWKCVPAGDSVAPGPIVLYTRVKSPHATVVVHRWYRGDVLRRSVRLPTDASSQEGYRTFSRQTVDRGDWRVEVRSAAGDLLYEQHLAVR